MNLFKAFFLTVPIFLATGLAAQDARDPVQIIRETTDTLFKLVAENHDSYESDAQALRDDIREVLLAEFDTLYSGRLVLGRSARGMEHEKVEEFADALSALLIGRYADGLLQFRTRDQVEIRPLAGDNTERMTRVKTRVGVDNGQQAPVDYVFRKTDEGWKIFDVIVEGISYVTTFRNQIGEAIRQDGFDATLETLKRGELEIETDG
jgi:phospholipid transport system substrate-binding protein